MRWPCLEEDGPDVDCGGAVLDHVVHGLQVVQLDRLGDPLHGLKRKGYLYARGWVNFL